MLHMLPETEWVTLDANDDPVPYASTDIVYSTDPEATMQRILAEAKSRDPA